MASIAEQLAKKISDKIASIPADNKLAVASKPANFMTELKVLFEALLKQEENSINQTNDKDYFKNLFEKNNVLRTLITNNIAPEDQGRIRKLCTTAFEEFGKEQLALKNTSTIPTMAPPKPPQQQQQRPNSAPPSKPLQSTSAQSLELAKKLRELEKRHEQELNDLENKHQREIEKHEEQFINTEHKIEINDFKREFASYVKNDSAAIEVFNTALQLASKNKESFSLSNAFKETLKNNTKDPKTKSYLDGFLRNQTIDLKQKVYMPSQAFQEKRQAHEEQKNNLKHAHEKQKKSL